MIKEKESSRGRNGFTLVELLAVIVILAIILVIAVPKVMSIIEDAKKGTLESTAKMIASGAEKQKIQNTVLGNTEEITCESVAKINKGDYGNCSIEFEDNTAKVTIEGKGKFDNLWVCDGTKTNAKATNEECISPLEVKHPLFLAGQELTPEKFEVTLTESDGSTRKLWSGGLKADDSKAVTVTSPNWPNNYPANSTNEIEKTFDGADYLEITFDPASSFADDFSLNSSLIAYDNNGNVLYEFSSFSGKTYVIPGNYVKIKISTGWYGVKGYSATIKPMYNVEPEYTISPSVAPNTEGNFDITITVKGENTSKKITTNVGAHEIEDYVESHKGFDTVQTNATYNETTYDAGIRYVGEMDEVNNKVYYNCESIDSKGVSYGENDYDYASSCEVWRIIGVFDTKPSTSGIAEKRVKLINTASTFQASWDSSVNTVNNGKGINQWGPSGEYKGADLMRLLNGYYIGAENATCTYCLTSDQETCSKTCDTEENQLISQNMKPLTTKAKSMIGNAVWDTYAVKAPDSSSTPSSWAPIAYLEEKGISEQNTGKNLCVEANGSDYSDCNDSVERTTSWTGLVGLMSVSDMTYADGWLYNQSGASIWPWSISPTAYHGTAYFVWFAHDDYASNRANSNRGLVFASVYLNSDIKVISGNGDDQPYILK